VMHSKLVVALTSSVSVAPLSSVICTRVLTFDHLICLFTILPLNPSTPYEDWTYYSKENRLSTLLSGFQHCKSPQTEVSILYLNKEIFILIGPLEASWLGTRYDIRSLL
jgi:hypothetical protein